MLRTEQLEASKLGGKYIIPAAEVKSTCSIYDNRIIHNYEYKYKHISMSINAGYRT